MTVNFDAIKCKYTTSEDLECDSYDEARIVEVLRSEEAQGLYISSLEATKIAKVILKVFDISLNMQDKEEPLQLSAKPAETPVVVVVVDDDIPF